jgi:hypothetical protein
LSRCDRHHEFAGGAANAGWGVAALAAAVGIGRGTPCNFQKLEEFGKRMKSVNL